MFVADNIRSISASELASRLDDELYSLNQRENERGGRRFPKSAKAYLDDWAAPEVGWLRKYYRETALAELMSWRLDELEVAGPGAAGRQATA